MAVTTTSNMPHPVVALHSDERNYFVTHALKEAIRSKIQPGGTLAISDNDAQFSVYWNDLLNPERNGHAIYNLAQKLLNDTYSNANETLLQSYVDGTVVSPVRRTPAQWQEDLDTFRTEKRKIQNIQNNGQSTSEETHTILRLAAGKPVLSLEIDKLHHNEQKFLADLKQKITTGTYEQSDVDAAVTKYQDLTKSHLNTLLNKKDSDGNPYFSSQEKNDILSTREQYYAQLKQQLKATVETGPIALFFAEQYRAVEEKPKSREHRHLTSTSFNKWQEDQASSSTAETKSKGHQPGIDIEGTSDDMSTLMSLPGRLPRQSVTDYHFKNPCFGEEKLEIPKFRISETSDRKTGTSLTFHALGRFGQVEDRLFTNKELVEGYSRLIENALAKGMIPPLGLSRLNDKNLNPGVREAVLKFAARCGIPSDQIRNYTMSAKEKTMYDAELKAWSDIVKSPTSLTNLVQAHAAGFVSGNVNLKPENFTTANSDTQKSLFKDVAGTQERIDVLSSSALSTTDKIALLQTLSDKPKELAQVLNGLNSSALSSESITNMMGAGTLEQWKPVLKHLSLEKRAEYFSQLPDIFQKYLWEKSTTSAERAVIINKNPLHLTEAKILDYVADKNFVDCFGKLDLSKKAEVFSALVRKEPLSAGTRNYTEKEKTNRLKQLYSTVGPDPVRQKEFFNALDSDAQKHLLSNPPHNTFFTSVLPSRVAGPDDKIPVIVAMAHMDPASKAYQNASASLTADQRNLVAALHAGHQLGTPISSDPEISNFLKAMTKNGNVTTLETNSLQTNISRESLSQAFLASLKSDQLVNVTKAFFKADNTAAANADIHFDVNYHYAPLAAVGGAVPPLHNDTFKKLSEKLSDKQRYDLVTKLLSSPTAADHQLAAVVMSGFTPKQQMAIIQLESDADKKKTLSDLILNNIGQWKYTNNYGQAPIVTQIVDANVQNLIYANLGLSPAGADAVRLNAIKNYKDNPIFQFNLLKNYTTDDDERKTFFAQLDSDNQAKLLEIQYATHPAGTDDKTRLASVTTLVSEILKNVMNPADCKKLADICKTLDPKIMSSLLNDNELDQDIGGKSARFHVLEQIILKPDNSIDASHKDKFTAAFKSISNADAQEKVFNGFTKSELKTMTFPHLADAKQNAVITGLKDDNANVATMAGYLSNPALPPAREKELFALIDTPARALSVYLQLNSFSREKELFSTLKPAQQIQVLETRKDVNYQIAVIKTLPDPADNAARNNLRALFEKITLPASPPGATPDQVAAQKAQSQVEFFRALNPAQQAKLIDRDGWNSADKLSDAAIKNIILGSNKTQAKSFYEKLSVADKATLDNDEAIQRHIAPSQVAPPPTLRNP